MEDPIARLDLIGLKSSGNKFLIVVEFGKPYIKQSERGPDYAACPLSIKGLYDNLSDMCGDNTFQALSLAMQLAYNLLNDFRKKGGVLFFADGETEYNLEENFPTLGEKSKP